MFNALMRVVAQAVAALALLAGIVSVILFFVAQTVLQEIAAATLAGAFFLLGNLLMLSAMASYADDILKELKR